MIVVDTSTSKSPLTKPIMTSSSSCLVHLTVADRDARARRERLQCVAHAVDRLDAVVDEVDLAAAVELLLQRRGDKRVAGRRRRPSSPPCDCSGAVWISEKFGTPTSDMCSVRGIGVADSVSTSTERRISLRRSLCATPKRCSSSTITRPRFLKPTSRSGCDVCRSRGRRCPRRAVSVSFCSAFERNVRAARRSPESGEALGERAVVLAASTVVGRARPLACDP